MIYLAACNKVSANTLPTARKLDEFRRKAEVNLALDGGNNLAYIAPTMINLSLSQERYPDIEFKTTREH